MSTRQEDPTTIFHRLLKTLHELPPTSAPDQLERLTKLYPTLGSDDIKTEKDLIRRERIMREFEEERERSELQSRLYQQAQDQLDLLIQSTRRPLSPAPLSNPSKRTKPRQPSEIPARNSPALPSDLYGSQLPLEPGRKVAFRQKMEGPRDGTETGWILAEVKGMLGGDRYRYEVVDVDADSGVKEVFKTTLKSLIPLSNPSAPLSSESHPSRYPEYPPGHKIAAIYPGTSCFYRGTVFRSPVPVQGGQGQGGKKGKYVIVFEEDGGSQTEVEFELVLDGRQFR